MNVCRFTKAKKFKFSIKGENGERHVNECIQGLMDFRYDRISKIILENGEIAVFIVFDTWHDGTGYRKDDGTGCRIRVIAKQFSKKKYASCDEGIKKFPESKNWKEICRIEKEKYWLVIFKEIR